MQSYRGRAGVEPEVFLTVLCCTTWAKLGAAGDAHPGVTKWQSQYELQGGGEGDVVSVTGFQETPRLTVCLRASVLIPC